MKGGLLPGLLAAIICVASPLFALSLLWFNAEQTNLSSLLNDSYLHHILLFTLLQACLSTLLSCLLAIPIARALYRRQFIAKSGLLKLCAITLVLPTLVAIFGLLTIYGQQGWLASLLALFHIPYSLSPYGISGILLAHCFFNVPLAVRMLYQALGQIPTEQRQQAALLNLRGAAFFYWIEWPWIKRQLLPTAALIFLLCFTSFTIVLTLGGGPKATTLELAIYQALSYDFDPGRAALLALIQLVVGGILVMCSLRLNRGPASTEALLLGWQDHNSNRLTRLTDSCWIILLILLLVPPLLATLLSGFSGETFRVLKMPALWEACGLSLKIAFCSGITAVTLGLMLLWSSREFRRRRQILSAQLLESSGMLILTMPSIVLATGLFLLSIKIPTWFDSLSPILILCHALLAVPYILKILDTPMWDLTQRYHNLCLSLGISGWRRLYLIEFKALHIPLTQAFSVGCAVSLGDFGLISLLGNENFKTLPFYLYQQIGAYRTADAAVTAMLLLILSLFLFFLIEKLAGKHAHC